MRRQAVHLINQFKEVGGTELRALGLAAILADHADVRIWATDAPNPHLAGRLPIDTIEPREGRFPFSGTFVFVGVHFRVGRWIRLARPSRRIIIFNIPRPDLFPHFERQTARTLTLRPVPCEIVYATELLRPMLGRPGVVQESPIDIETFHPPAHADSAIQAAFRVGRLSRDHPEKFHEQDAHLFQSLAGHGVDVRLMGGSCIGLPAQAGITVTAFGSEPAAQFLHSLDCFVYRTRSDWLETFGRVVFEAMASGLPVVVGRRGGYAEFIRHGENGYFFDTNEEAIGYILRLRDDAELRRRMGENARRTAEAIYSSGYKDRIIEFYTRPA